MLSKNQVLFGFLPKIPHLIENEETRPNIIKNKRNLIKLGIGDWGLGIGDWGLGPIPNPQSPIPNPHLVSKNYKIINVKINKI